MKTKKIISLSADDIQAEAKKRLGRKLWSREISANELERVSKIANQVIEEKGINLILSNLISEALKEAFDKAFAKARPLVRAMKEANAIIAKLNLEGAQAQKIGHEACLIVDWTDKEIAAFCAKWGVSAGGKVICNLHQPYDDPQEYFS